MVAGGDLEPILLTISAAEDGERLDRVLSARPLGFSRSTIARLIDEGRVRVDGERPRRSDPARAGATVRIEPSPPPPSAAIPQDIPLSIVHEDDAVLVIDKPAGLVVHPAAGHPDGTLVNALLHHGGIDDGGDPARPGIVHRLDKDTSGVMVVAKTPAARDHLVAAFAAHDIERSYRAIALGNVPDAVTYDTLHGRHPTDRKKFSSRVVRGKRAVTHVTVRQRLHGAALVECRLDTGRTHQIRVHLADHRHPLLGDPVYGRSPRDPRLRAVAATLGRQALHAAALGFVHPSTRQSVRFEVPPPADFDEAVRGLS